MENSIQIEVHETVEDLKELYKRSNYFIKIPIILLLFLVLSEFLSDEKNSILKMDQNYKIFFGIFVLIFIIGFTIAMYFNSLKNFKKDLEENHHNHNYIIHLYMNHLELEKNEKQFVEYGNMKLKKTKNHYFITYRAQGRKNVCLIKKSGCSPEAIDFLEKLLKK